MTRVTSHFHVRASQSKSGLVVIKTIFAGDAPALSDVTLGALFLEECWSKHFFMRALMAVFASLGCELTPMINSGFCRAWWLLMPLRNMTLRTF